MERTGRLGLPMLVGGQAGKEVTHNEALLVLDALVGGVVEAVGVDTPPDGAGTGRCWIVGAAPTGAWTGQAGAVACRTEGGWRFVPASEGLEFTMRATGAPVALRGGHWRVGEIVAERVVVKGKQVLAGRQAAVGDAMGGAVVDTEARAALSGILAALREHGLIEA